MKLFDVCGANEICNTRVHMHRKRRAADDFQISPLSSATCKIAAKNAQLTVRDSPAYCRYPSQLFQGFVSD